MRFSAREIFIAVLLVASLVLVALLTWEAFDAARSHRVTAQTALHDYAAFAAREFLRRAESDLGYGLYDVASAFRSVGGEGVPTPTELAAGQSERVAAAVGLVATVFRVTPEGVETAGAEPADGARSFLEEELLSIVEGGAGERSYFDATSRVIDGRRHIFVYYPRDPSADAVLGFEVDMVQIGRGFEALLGGEAILPATLGSGTIGNDGLIVEVIDQGRPLFSTGGTFDPYTGVEIELGEELDGLLDGATLRCGIDPAAAQRLIAGGLPPLRLPFLLGVTLLTFALLITAIVLFRREVELSRMRTDFISSVSHELRTPLTQIRMFSETLRLKRVRSVDEEERALEIIDQEAKRLGHLVENILQFSRMERGALRLELEPVSLDEIVHSIVEGFAPLARSAGVELVVESRSDAVVRADRDAVRQILINLLDNAIKYGPRGQEIVVAVAEEDDAVVLSVEDQGPGIPAGERAKVWDRFQRLAGEDSGVAGAGIGLAVVRELVSLHEGSVHVGSGRNGGARFSVSFPLTGPPEGTALRESEAY